MGSRRLSGRRVIEPWVRFAIAVVGIPAVPAAARAQEAPDEVEVRGDVLATASRDGAVAAGVIGRESLRAPGLRASDVLRMQPGVQVSESGGAGALATASIRGATAAQTPVYLAGIRINDDVGGTADLSLVPLWLIRRVEVYRGNAPIQADRAGIGGAIFFDPERPSDLKPTIGLQIGSFGTRGAWAYAGAGADRTAAAVGFRHDEAVNDYEFTDDRGARFDPTQERRVTRTNAYVQTDDAWALGTTRIGQRGRIDIIFNGIVRRQGLPGLSVLPTREASGRQQRALAGVNLSTPCAARDCELTLSTSAIASDVASVDPLGELALGSARVDTSATRIEERGMLRLRLSPAVGLSTALRASSENLGIDYAGFAGERARRLTLGAATMLEWFPKDWMVLRSLITGTCDATTSSGTSAGSLCGEFSPTTRVGAEFGSTPARLLVNVAHYTRVPTLGERFGVSGTVRGNPRLEAETAVVAELGARLALKFVQLEAFLFLREASDLVAYSRATTGYVVPFNVGRAQVRGAELTLAVVPVRFVEVVLPAALLDARDTSPERQVVNDRVPFRSALTLAPQILVKIPTLDGIGVARSRVALSYLYQSSRYADPAGLIIIPEQGTFDVDASTSNRSDTLRARLRVSNILNQSRFDLIGFPLPGRAAYVAMEGRW